MVEGVARGTAPRRPELPEKSVQVAFHLPITKGGVVPLLEPRQRVKKQQRLVRRPFIATPPLVKRRGAL
jgi:hypothetical protein